jgi:hypothetical protein
VPEQIAALRGLAAIGKREAAAADLRIITEGAVQGLSLDNSVHAAVLLECRLPAAVSLPLLRHNDAPVRAPACCVARLHAEVMPVLVDLLDDLHRLVAVAAACALGRAGRIEAQPVLARLLRDEPSAEVIDAVTSVANDDCIVQLGGASRVPTPCGRRRQSILWMQGTVREHRDSPRHGLLTVGSESIKYDRVAEAVPVG